MMRYGRGRCRPDRTGDPISDPTAEGPVIQEANVRALSAGTTTDKIFDMVVRIRKTVKISLVFMTYAM